MLTLTVDVRAADGSKSLQLTNIGQVVNLQVWAEITDPQNQPTQDGVQDIGGSFLSTNVGPGPVAGRVTPQSAAPADRGQDSGSVTSATVASSALMRSSAAAATATPCSPAPSVIWRPRIRSSATTGQALVDPSGVMVPRS